VVAIRSTVDDRPPSGAVVVDVSTLFDEVEAPEQPQPPRLGAEATSRHEAFSRPEHVSHQEPPRRQPDRAPLIIRPQPAPPAAESGPLPARRSEMPPVAVPSRRQRRAARHLQARKVGRIVRHLDLWSILKLSLLFHLAAFLITVIAGVLVWSVGITTGVTQDLENFIREAFALQSFAFDGERIFRAAVFGGLALVLAATALTVLVAAMFNLVSDLVGGIRVTVVEEETLRPRLTQAS
jgi:hypothetical protein